MNAKVLRLVTMVEEGHELGTAAPRPDGGLRLSVGRGPDAREFDFAFYEVPAILAATRVVGIGG